MGDFFEVSEFYPDLDRTRGSSLLIINNGKGERFFNSVEDKFEVLPISERQYLPVKGNLQVPSPRPRVRNCVYSGIDILSPNKFFKRFKEHSAFYVFAVKTRRILRMGISTALPLPMKNALKRFLKKFKRGA